MNRGKRKLSIRYAMLIPVLIVLSIMVSQVDSAYTVRVFDLALIYGINAFGLLLMLGMGGQLVYSGVAFMGIGAYTAANLCSGRLGVYLDSGLVLLLAILAGGLTAFLFGLPLLRLKGTFFTFATIGIVQIFYTFFLNFKPLFGGPAGISGIKTMTMFGIKFDDYYKWFYFLLILIVIVMLILNRARNSQFGRQLAAIRDNEIAAQVLGVNIYWTRVKAFTISGMLGGLSGALLAMLAKYIGADNFSYARASTFIIMAMLGGVNSAPGIILGSVIVTLLPEVLRGMDQYLMFIYGVLVIVLMILMPMGIFGLGTSIAKHIKELLRKKQVHKTDA